MMNQEELKQRLIRLIADVQYLGGLEEKVADHLIANGVTIRERGEWIPASEPPKEYRDEYGELFVFLCCEEGTRYPFRAMYDGKNWGDGCYVIPVKWWMPLPKPPETEKGGAE